MIDGVTLTPLTAHRDERGTFCEVARASQLPEPPAQLSHSFMHAGVVKAWHIHVQQWDYWYLVTGRLKVVLYDARFHIGHEKQTHLPWMGRTAITAGQINDFILEANQPPLIGTMHEDFRMTWEMIHDRPALLHIPPGVAHGCKALSDYHLVYLTSREYDGTDEGRIAHDDLTIGYDWEKGPEIK